VIDGQATSAHVVADEQCRGLEIREDTAWALMRTSHNIAYNLIRVLAHRLRGGNSVISTTQELQREYERYALIDSLTASTIDAGWTTCCKVKWTTVRTHTGNCP
jgi:CRP-like cAMP-binding protein